MKFTKFLIPENLDFKALIIEKLGEKHLQHLPKYLYFVHRLYYLRNNNPSYGKFTFIELNREYLEIVLNSNMTTPVIQNLINWGIIECDSKAIKGVKSYGYRLSEQYTSSKTIIYTNTERKYYAKFKILSKNISKCIDKLTSDKINRYPEYKFIVNCALKIDINYVGAINYIKHALDTQMPLPDKQVEVIKTNKYGKKYIAKEWVRNRVFNSETYNSYLSVIIAIQNGEHNFSIDPKSKRIYTTLTNCPNNLWQFVTHSEGVCEDFYSIDIKSSQPYLLMKFTTNIIKTGEYKRYGVCPSKLHDDLEVYQKIYSDGIYEFLMENSKKTITRDEAKDKLFTQLFFNKEYKDPKNNEIKKSETAKIFEKVIPEIVKLILNYKIMNINGNKKFCAELQKIEAKIMINDIVKEISKIKYDFKIVPKHDALVVAEKGVATEIEKLIQAKITKYVGFPVQLKIEKLCNKNSLVVVADKDVATEIDIIQAIDTVHIDKKNYEGFKNNEEFENNELQNNEEFENYEDFKNNELKNILIESIQFYNRKNKIIETIKTVKNVEQVKLFHLIDDS